MRTFVIACTALLAVSRVHAAWDTPSRVVARDGKNASPTQKPSALPTPNNPTSHGCYKSSGNMTAHQVKDMSSGSCLQVCTNNKYWVTGLHTNECYCGFAYPSDNDLVSDDKCTYPCPSYPLEVCGGIPGGSNRNGFWSVFNTGVNVNALPLEDPSTSSSTSEPTDQPKTSDAGTPSASASSSQLPISSGSDHDSQKRSPNTAGIAAGAVVAALVAAAIAGTIFFCVRRKRKAEIEEEHRRNAAVSAFINGSKPPGSSGSVSMTDSRLDPVLANRRMSDGSIADNEDYSRRILRVCRVPPTYKT